MQNFYYKIMFVISLFISSTQAVLGATNASEYYTYYTRQFLGHLGLKNPSTVSIRKINSNDALYASAAGYANGTAIYLNEDMFEKHSESSNLFTCAHEAAHHALRHPFQIKRNTLLAIEEEADVRAARMLCTHGYRWVVEEKVDLLRRLVRAGQGEDTDGQHPTIQQEYLYLRNVLETNHDSNPDKAVPERNGPHRNPAERGRNPNANKAGPKRNGPNRNVDNTGPKRNADNANRDNIGSERKPSDKNNSYRERKPYRSGMEDLKDLLRQFNNLSSEQKLLIAGIVGVRIMGWL